VEGKRGQNEALEKSWSIRRKWTRKRRTCHVLKSQTMLSGTPNTSNTIEDESQREGGRDVAVVPIRSRWEGLGSEGEERTVRIGPFDCKTKFLINGSHIFVTIWETPDFPHAFLVYQ